MSVDLFRIHGPEAEKKPGPEVGPGIELAGCPDKTYVGTAALGCPAGRGPAASATKRVLYESASFATQFFSAAPSSPGAESGRSTSASRSVATRTAESPQ